MARTRARATARVTARNSALAEEARLLLRLSLEALSGGDRERARAHLDEHQRRFPNGVLRAERERARVRLSESSTEPLEAAAQ